jgi:predicted nuclease of predicted toxin-antitoxin system
LKLVLDMNLSPSWVAVLQAAGHEAVHWTSVGSPLASDHEVLGWARTHRRVLLTHDLDFGAILAASQAQAPSVLQIRTQDVTPVQLSRVLLAALLRYREYLESGALVTLDEGSSRARVLPLGRVPLPKG